MLSGGGAVRPGSLVFIHWDSNRDHLGRRHLVSCFDAVEAIQESMDLQSYARVEDLNHLHQRIEGLTDDLEGVMDSVGVLLMEDEQLYWSDD